MKKSESVFFRSGELRMHAARHPGSGDRPIVVVPGITTPAGAFAVAASRLTQAGSDVYVLDMRGRGLWSGSRTARTGPVITPTTCWP